MRHLTIDPAWAEKQQLVGRCMFCRWTLKGALPDVRAAASQHQADKHPEAVAQRRQPGRYSSATKRGKP